MKTQQGFPENIPHKELEPVVEMFYKEEFWDKVKGDDVPDQNIAEWLFDIAVNASPRRAGTYLQKALNLLNRNERDYADLKVDGAIGGKTIAALKKYLHLRDSNALLLWIGVQFGGHWMNRAESSPDQEEFMNGISNRVVSNVERVADSYYLT